MANDQPSDVKLTSLHRSDTRTLDEWTTTFQLVVVALDPYTYESSWILPTATRILRNFAEADCRTAFLMACEPDEARQFLGPLAEELLVLVDPDRSAIGALGAQRLPALIHIDQTPTVRGMAQGWDPAEWRQITTDLATAMSWQRPAVPQPDDPVPFEGTPVSR